jgi:hypothetical protein
MGDWGDIAVLRGTGCVVFPFLYSWLRICVVELCVEALNTQRMVLIVLRIETGSLDKNRANK